MSTRHGDDAPGRRLLPDFDVVWSARRRASCRSCELLTPRNAAQLWVAATQLADILDAERVFIHTPVHGAWVRLPWVVFCVPDEWYGQFVDTVLNLADDVAAGRCPVPRCTGEEMALHLILENIVEPDDYSNLPDLIAIACDGLPISDWDSSWELLAAELFPNPRVRALLADNFGGIDDDLELVAETGIVRLAPERWLHTFGDVPERPTPACGCKAMS